MKVKKEAGNLKKKTWILFAIIVLSIIIDIVVADLTVKLIFELIYFVCAVALLVYSIKLIKKKSLGLGITFLVISAIVILIVLVSFLTGLIYGLVGVLQGETGVTGEAISGILR